tara:strand:- start:1920 stop:2930 length:1011 start_codon:yes stop_codon:yes gene_type:complete
MLDIVNINNYPINEVKDNFNALELTTLNFGVALRPITFQCQFQGEIPFYDNEIPKELGRLVLKTNPDNGFLLRDYKECNYDQIIKNSCLGIVGLRYKPMLNGVIFNLLKKCLLSQIPIENLQDAVLTETSAKNGAFSRFEIMFPKMQNVIDQKGRYDNTRLNFRIAVNNTFDGSGRLVIDAGFFDQVCSNGLKIGSYETDTSKHTGNLTEEKIEYFISEQIESSKDKIEQIQKWSNIPVNGFEIKEKIFEKFFSETQAKKMHQQFKNECLDRGKTLWSVVSTLTYWSSSDNVRNNGVEFSVRNTGLDNVASTLDSRQKIVDKILKSKEFQELSLVA